MPANIISVKKESLNSKQESSAHHFGCGISAFIECLAFFCGNQTSWVPTLSNANGCRHKSTLTKLLDACVLSRPKSWSPNDPFVWAYLEVIRKELLTSGLIWLKTCGKLYSDIVKVSRSNWNDSSRPERPIVRAFQPDSYSHIRPNSRALNDVIVLFLKKW